MSNKVKMTKDTVPENFTIGLAAVDAIPVVLFAINCIILGTIFNSPLFVAGSVICFLAGLLKVIWKIIVVIKRKNIWWMFVQMRVLMPIGFLIIVLGFIVDRANFDMKDLVTAVYSFPAILFFVLWLVCMILMGFFGVKLDASDAKSNWIEQGTNGLAHLFFLIGIIFGYLAVYYHADETALSYIESPAEGVEVLVYDEEEKLEFVPETIKAGIVFYPGAKVDYKAYAPLLEKLAEEGYLCIVEKMPGNVAVLDIDAADEMMENWTEVDHWYIAGHSMGGAIAAYYLQNNIDKFDGMILLAAYSTKDFSGADTRVLSIYGSEDGVLNRESYDENLKNMPADFTEHVIEGGCHAYFGSYGAQKNDGRPSITPESQWDETVAAITSFIK